MWDSLTAITERARHLLALAEVQGSLLLLPSRLIQLALLALCLAVAWLLRWMLYERVTERLRTLEGRPKWQLRTLLVLRNRMRLIFFVLLAWAVNGAMMSASPFPSRRYLIVLVATIATAVLLIGLAARLIRNRSLRRIVTWGLGIYVTLYYLGLLAGTTAFLDSIGVQLGSFRLSAYGILKAVVVTGLLLALARLVSGGAATRIRTNQDLSPSMRVLVVKVMQVVLYAAAFFIGLKAVGFDLTGLAVLSGAIGVGIGFGLQKVVSNLVSGFIILLDKSIKPGDVISLGDTFGWVVSLGARYVSLTTRDGREYLIPNEDLITGQVVNWTHSNDYVRIDITFGTAYGADPHQVRKLAVEAAMKVPRVLSFRPAVCHITGFGDSSVDYILRFWISDPTEGLTNIRGNVFLALWDVFKQNGISIPFPQREVKVLGGSVLETRQGTELDPPPDA